MTPPPASYRAIAELPADLSDLVEMSRSEGFRFLVRLVDDWRTSANRFSRPGERLVEARHDSDLCAIGGINVDPYPPNASLGRLRRVYVAPRFRGLGVGRGLVGYLLRDAGEHFEEVRLRTDRAEAAAFYETLGFRPLESDPEATHAMRLRSPSEA